MVILFVLIFKKYTFKALNGAAAGSRDFLSPKACPLIKGLWSFKPYNIHTRLTTHDSRR